MEDQFRIWITFSNGSQTLDTDWSPIETIESSLRRLFHGPISKMNVLSEVRVVDMSDCIVFLVQDGKQVFPEAA
jgi:hypothetical protein